MFRRIFALGSLPALAVIGSLLVAEPAAAQQGQNLYEWSGGWGRTSGGSSYAGGYGSLESTAPTYYAPPGYYVAPSTPPSGPMIGYQPGYTPAIAQEYGYFAPSAAGEAPALNREVVINVSVPANAEIWIEGKKTAERGTVRQFISPPLTAEREYSYDIKARWMEEGKEVTRSRRLTVHAGDVVNLSFGSGTASRSRSR